MEEGLKIQIGADVTELISGLSKASAALKAFGSTGSAGAKEIEKAIKQLSKSTKGLSGEELERVNTLIAKLRDLSVQLGTKAAVSVNILGGALQDLSADAATVTPQIEKLSTAITKIPEGSFSVSLNADVAAYLPKIEGASEALKQLGQTGIIAGNQVEAALLELGKAAQQAGTADLLKLNAAINAIGSASEKFKTTGTQAFDSFGNSVQQAASKVAIVGPAIANAVKEVEVIKSSGFTIKIHADTQEAIQGLRFVSKETKALGVSGEASVGQVEKAIIDLNKALKNGGGGVAEIERIKTALAGMIALSVQFGNAGKEGFDKFGQAIPPLVAAIESIPEVITPVITVEGLDNAVAEINAKVESIDNAVNITPTVNEQGAVNDLETISAAAVDAKVSVENIASANPVINVETSGIETTTKQVDELDADLKKLQKTGDFELKLSVDAKNAISNVEGIDAVLEKLGRTGELSLKDIQRAMRFLTEASKKPGANIEHINAAMAELTKLSTQLGTTAKSDLDKLGTSAESTGKKIKSVTPASAKASDSLRDLGRIATDAPFGFIAISNNIQPLIDSLGALSASTKGAGGFLKALGGALIGPAGLAIGFAAVTGAVTYAVQKYGSLGDAVDALFQKTNAAATAARELAKANEEAFKNSGKELGELKALTNVAQDKSKSDIERRDAVLELQRVYPSYFGNLSQEAILNGDVADATRDATNAIYQKARAAAGAARIGDLAGQELQNTADATEATKKYAAALQKLEQVKKFVKDNDLNKTVGGKNQGSTLIAAQLQVVENARQNLEKVGAESVSIQKQLKETFDLLTGVDIVGKDKLRLDALDAIVKKNQDLIDSGNKDKKVQQDLNDALAEQYSIKAKAAGIDDKTIQAVAASIKAGTFKQKLDKQSEKSLEKQISLLEDLRKTVGLNINEEQKLLDLRIQAAALTLKEQGATPTQAINKINQIKTQFELEGIDIAIEKLQKFGELLDLTRSKRENIFELKFKKIQLENPDLTKEGLKIIALNLQQTLDLNPLVIPIEFEIPKIDTSKIKKPDFKDLTNPLTGNNRNTEENDIQKQQDQLEKLSNTVSQEVAPVFANLFDSIGKDGVSALDVLGDALNQVIKKLIAAAAQAAIFEAITAAFDPTGSFSGFGGKFLSSFKGLLGLQANLGSQNRQFVRGNMANVGRDELITQLRGRDIDIMIRRNGISNNRFA